MVLKFSHGANGQMRYVNHVVVEIAPVLHGNVDQVGKKEALQVKKSRNLYESQAQLSIRSRSRY